MVPHHRTQERFEIWNPLEEQTEHANRASEGWWPLELLGIPLANPRHLSARASTPYEFSEIKRLLLQKNSRTRADLHCARRNETPRRERGSKMDRNRCATVVHANLGHEGKSIPQHANLRPQVQWDHDYCLPEIKVKEKVTDSFIADCLLNPHLEEEVSREMEIMRAISQQGLAIDPEGSRDQQAADKKCMQCLSNYSTSA